MAPVQYFSVSIEKLIINREMYIFGNIQICVILPLYYSMYTHCKKSY
jgi:hypothetical protein